ncbi:C1QL [Mytilus coruscus]|uniref:C1QL n=1 Tax=Mytilus coruscus TaxID=42192 RepID=A0A6J8E9B1_MYTCO|nr:C1QL [Mytilus coruscus]
MALNVLSLMFAQVFVTYVLANSENIYVHSKILLIEKTIEAQGIEIADLKGTVKNQQKEINRLNQIVTNLQEVYNENQIVAFRTNEINLESKNGSKVDLHAINSQEVAKGYTNIHNNIDEKPRESRLLTASVPVQPSSVAFYAQLSISEQNIGKHHPIVFDHVILNVGNGYNKHSGTFAAPTSGIYVFTFLLFPSRSGKMAVNIFKNSEAIAQIFTEMRTDTFSGTTPVAVIDMNVGDIAFVRTSSTYQPYGDVNSNVNQKVHLLDGK